MATLREIIVERLPALRLMYRIHFPGETPDIWDYALVNPSFMTLGTLRPALIAVVPEFTEERWRAEESLARWVTLDDDMVETRTGRWSGRR